CARRAYYGYTRYYFDYW
nr:immunoglobulin heavy chain junction region [Mus musculus]MBK4196969.1 immunoglobulin heavy chain junction region [Mus musculus]